MDLNLPHDFLSSPASSFITKDIRESLPDQILLWEAYIDGNFVLENAQLIEDTDRLLQEGSSADIIIFFDPSHSHTTEEDLKNNNYKKHFDLICLFEEQFGIPFIWINKSLSKFDEISAETLKQELASKPIDPQILRDLFSETDSNTSLKKLLPFYQKRQSQLYMIKYVIEAFNNSLTTLIEAPTGTGKTIAYLLPSILFAHHNKKKVVISTFTKHLQHQLLDKDIPLASKMLGLPVLFSLLKGKQNYLCLKRFEETKISHKDSTTLLPSDESVQQNISKINDWLSTTDSGDLEELLSSTTKGLWDDINIQMDLCAHSRCPFFQDCFYYKSKKKQEESQLLIVNHSLLVAQLKLEYDSVPNVIIPEFEHLIIDEAHNFPKTSLLEQRATNLALMNRVYKIYNAGTSSTKKTGGLLNSIAKFLRSSNIQTDQAFLTDIIQKEIKPATTRIDQKASFFFKALIKIVSQNIEKNQSNFRIKESNQKIFMPLKDAFDSLKESILYFNHEVDLISSKLVFFPEEFKLQHQTQLKLLSQIPKKLEEDLDLWSFLFYIPNPNTALWIDYIENTTTISIYCVNLNNTEFLNQTLYKSKKTIVMTSATLSVKKDFQLFKKSIGLENSSSEFTLPNVFKYKEQCLFVIPKNIAEPTSDFDTTSKYYSQSLSFIIQCLKLKKGGALILCTSFKQMNFIYDSLAQTDLKINLFLQNTKSQSELLSDFKKAKNGVLIGVDSFWEGIDIAGSALSLLFIMKIPFKPPNHPITETQCEILKNEGSEPFKTLTVPEAVIKFKQGFGRLIRTEKDRGVVICLDTRLISKPFYGSTFIDSLPVSPINETPEKLLPIIQEFFNTTKA